MPMVKETIKAEIEQAFVQVMNDTEDREASIDKVAESLATAMMNAIQSITITYVGGLVSPTGAVTGTLQITIE